MPHTNNIIDQEQDASVNERALRRRLLVMSSVLYNDSEPPTVDCPTGNCAWPVTPCKICE
jgi:hypothetical protein